MHLKIVKRIDDYGTYHTPTLIICSPREKPKYKPIEQTPYQSSFVNMSGFRESISIYIHKRSNYHVKINTILSCTVTYPSLIMQHSLTLAFSCVCSFINHSQVFVPNRLKQI